MEDGLTHNLVMVSDADGGVLVLHDFAYRPTHERVCVFMFEMVVNVMLP